MLTTVPAGVRNAARNVVLRHPNSMDCVVWRRRAVRTVAREGGDVGSTPTLGMLGQLDADDEAEFEYDPLGDAKLLPQGVMAPADLSDAADNAAASSLEAMRCFVESTSATAPFDVKDGDLVFVMPGLGVVVTYEVVNVQAQNHFPPYIPIVELVAQGDMMHVPGVAAMVAARS